MYDWENDLMSCGWDLGELSGDWENCLGFDD